MILFYACMHKKGYAQKDKPLHESIHIMLTTIIYIYVYNNNYIKL